MLVADCSKLPDNSKLGELTSENSKLKPELENSKKEIEALKSQPQKTEGKSCDKTLVNLANKHNIFLFRRFQQRDRSRTGRAQKGPRRPARIAFGPTAEDLRLPQPAKRGQSTCDRRRRHRTGVTVCFYRDTLIKSSKIAFYLSLYWRVIPLAWKLSMCNPGNQPFSSFSDIIIIWYKHFSTAGDRIDQLIPFNDF